MYGYRETSGNDTGNMSRRHCHRRLPQHHDAGNGTTADLLKLCRDAKDRKATAEKTGLSQCELLKWANVAGPMRISGVGQDYPELLEAAGVDAVKILRKRMAVNLAAMMVEISISRKLTRTASSETGVAGRVEQAGTLDPLITHQEDPFSPDRLVCPAGHRRPPEPASGRAAGSACACAACPGDRRGHHR